jgi:hypothetical protein
VLRARWCRNSTDAVRAYTDNRGLAKKVSHIIGRDPERPLSDLDLVKVALQVLDADQDECVFVGDSAIDVTAGHQAGVPVIGYANQAGKADQLAKAGADAVTRNLAISQRLYARHGPLDPAYARQRCGVLPNSRVHSQERPPPGCAMETPARHGRAVVARRDMCRMPSG